MLSQREVSGLANILVGVITSLEFKEKAQKIWPDVKLIL